MRKTIAQQFLEEARSDLRAAAFLHKGKHYSQSVFFLQQSVEKSLKALGLEAKFVEFNSLAKGQIGHSGHKIFIFGAKDMAGKVGRLLERIKENPDFFDFIMVPPNTLKQYHKRLQSEEGRIGNIKKDQFFSLNTADFDAIFSAFEKVRASISSIVDDIDVKEVNEFQPSFFQKLVEKGLVSGKEALEINDFFTSEEGLRWLFSVLRKVIEIELWSTHILFQLSLITVPHEASSRYPDEKTGHIPKAYYTGRLPLIKNLKSLISWHKQCISVVAGFIDT
jgi:HEPN domain-containing protein